MKTYYLMFCMLVSSITLKGIPISDEKDSLNSLTCGVYITVHEDCENPSATPCYAGISITMWRLEGCTYAACPLEYDLLDLPVTGYFFPMLSLCCESGSYIEISVILHDCEYNPVNCSGDFDCHTFSGDTIYHITVQ